MSLPQEPAPTFSDTVQDVLHFLRRPRLPEVQQAASPVLVFGQILALSLILSFGVLMLLGLLKEAGLVPEIPHAMEDVLKDMPLLLVLFLVALLMPALEELAFRFWLVFTPVTFLVSLWLVAVFLCGALLQVNMAVIAYSLVAIAAMLTALYFTFRVPAAQLLTRLYQQHYAWIFYGAAALFGLVHIINFKNVSEALIYAPLLVLPQLLLGLLLGYLRVRQGIGWAIALHGLYNAIVLSLAYVGMQAAEVPSP